MKFDIRKFGAAGDGRTDDTKAIQRAIDACPAGGTVLISDCRFYDTFSMFCLKTTRLRGAFIRRITMRDCVMQDRDTGVYAYRRHKGIIYIDSEYKDKNPAEAPPESLTRVSDIFLSNLQIDAPEVETTLYIKGFEDQPFENIVLEDIRSNCRGSDFIQNAEVHGAVRCNESLGTFHFDSISGQGRVTPGIHARPITITRQKT